MSDAATPRPLLLTGMQRSGTTLLEKLLAAHPQVSMLSQPLPLLMLAVKRQFLASLGIEDPLPFGHLFLEDRYRPADLYRFLDELQLTRQELEMACAEMATYSGQYTRFRATEIAQAAAALPVEPGFAPALAGLYRALARRSDPSIAGAKEMFAEELLPHLIARGWQAVLIVRDPRDVLASLNFGDGQRHAGAAKPTLLNVRNWRKGVAVALELCGTPGFSLVQYERLVADPQLVLGELTARLDLPPFPATDLRGGLSDQRGLPWPGNSSYGPLTGVDERPVGSWRERLPSTVARYVEATAFPELRRLGYTVEIDGTDVPALIGEFREPFEVQRAGLVGYSNHPENVAAEQERWRRLKAPIGEESRRWYLGLEAHRQLRDAALP
jgi:hypothetical protein